MQKKILLSISLLASRNAEDVKRCLDSLNPIRKAIPCEVIAVDTSGGDEELYHVLYEGADVIVPFTWCDNFAKARNAGLQRAKGEWFLYIDDDEWFVDMEQIIQFFKKGDCYKYDGANYLVRNFLNKQGTQWTDTWVSRMVHIYPETHFTSLIHEYLSPIPDKIVALKSMVYHFGYAYETATDRRKHFERNSSLLLNMIKQEPDNMRWRLQMLMEYTTVSDWNQLYDFADQGMELLQNKSVVGEDGAWSAFCAAKIIALEELNNYQKARDLCEKALVDKRSNELTQAFLCFNKGKSEIQMCCYEQAEISMQQYLKWKKYFDKQEVMLLNQGNMPFIGTIFEVQQLQYAYYILICAGLKQKNTVYLKKYWNQLGYDKENVIVYPFLPECMIEAMATMPKDEIFVSVLQTVSRNDGLWTAFRLGLLKWVMEEREGSLHLIKLLKEAGIDDSFLKVYYLRNQVCSFSEEKSGEDLQKLLETYVSCAVEYFKDSYSEQLELGHMEELPSDYRAVLLLQKLFEKKRLEEKLALVKQVVESYPPFAETMKRYIQVLQENTESQPNPKAMFQLQIMAQQVMKQIPVLLEAGQTAEAYQVVQQLRTMLPEDEQIRQLEERIRLSLN